MDIDPVATDSTDKLMSLKAADADAMLASDVPVLLDFWAPWCHPCRMLEPMVVRLQKRFGGMLKVAKVNVDMHDEMIRRFNVRSIPILVLAVNGRETLRLAAAECPEDHIVTELMRHLVPSPPLEVGA
jgi:thioredoxin 1